MGWGKQQPSFGWSPRLSKEAFKQLSMTAHPRLHKTEDELEGSVIVDNGAFQGVAEPVCTSSSSSDSRLRRFRCSETDTEAAMTVEAVSELLAKQGS